MRELNQDAIEETLRSTGIGVLSAVDTHDRPYGIPLSFGFGDQRLSFMLQTPSDGTSRKFDAITTSPQVCFSVTTDEFDAKNTWRSVIVEGEIGPVPDEEVDAAFFDLKDNGEFAPDIDVLKTPIEQIEVDFYQLPLTNLSGRKYEPEG